MRIMNSRFVRKFCFSGAATQAYSDKHRHGINWFSHERLIAALIAGAVFVSMISKIQPAIAEEESDQSASIQMVSSDNGGAGQPTAGLQSGPTTDSDLDAALLFVELLTRRGMAALTDHALGPVERQEALRQVFQNSFATSDIARLVLGRYWRGASEQEKYLFGENLANVAADTLVQNFPAGEFKIFDAREVEGPSNGLQSIEVKTVFVAESVSSLVFWTVRNVDGEIKALDIVIGNHSFLLAQKRNFEQSIQRNGGSMDATFAEMGIEAEASSAQ